MSQRLGGDPIELGRDGGSALVEDASGFAFAGGEAKECGGEREAARSHADK